MKVSRYSLGHSAPPSLLTHGYFVSLSYPFSSFSIFYLPFLFPSSFFWDLSLPFLSPSSFFGFISLFSLFSFSRFNFFFSLPHDHVTSYIKELEWLKVKQKYFELDVLVHNIINKSVPRRLLTLPRVGGVNEHVNLEQQQQLDVLKYHTCLG